LSERQRQAALERARTGAVDVSLDSSMGAFVEAGAVGPQQWLPGDTDPALVDYWRSREQYEKALVPALTVGEGAETKTYYKPPEFESTKQWYEAIGFEGEAPPPPPQFVDVPAGVQKPPELQIPIEWIETGEAAFTPAPNPQFNQSYYNLALTLGYDEDGANYFASSGVDPATYGQTEQVEELPDEQGNSILQELIGTEGLVEVSGVTSLPDAGDAWELAIGGPQIQQTVIPGSTGYAYANRRAGLLKGERGGSTIRIQTALAKMGKVYPI